MSEQEKTTIPFNPEFNERQTLYAEFNPRDFVNGFTQVYERCFEVFCNKYSIDKEAQKTLFLQVEIKRLHNNAELWYIKLN